MHTELCKEKPIWCTTYS